MTPAPLPAGAAPAGSLHCGPAHDPDQYRLLEHRHSGLEGELWQAERIDRDGYAHTCAVKILKLHPPHDTAEGRRHWLHRWEDSIHRAARLQLPDLVVPVACFLGATPHPRGASGRPDAPYLVSPWLEAATLGEWARRSPASDVERAELLVRLCRIVDDLHRLGFVHRDISPGNVLVDAAGSPKLIDLAFLAPLDRPLTAVVATPGYAIAEEEQHGGRPNEAKDRFAVGALARLLLLPDTPRLPDFDAAGVTARQLAAAGYPPDLAALLVRALDPDPRRRPAPLTPWAEQLRVELGEPALRAGPSCLALLADGRSPTTVITGGRRGVRWYGADSGAGPEDAPGAEGDHRAPAAGAPRDVVELAAGRTGTGEAVVAAVDRHATLWLGGAAGWQRASQGARGLALLTSPRGAALVWTGHPEGLRLTRQAAGAASTDTLFTTAGQGRVLAAAWGAEPGRPVVLLAQTSGLTAVTWPLDGREPAEHATVLDRPVRRATLALGRTGELEAVAILTDGTLRTLRRHFAGEWLAAGPPAATTGSDVAMAGLRGGPVLVTAYRAGVLAELTGPGGVRHPADVLTGPAAARVSVVQGLDSRLRIAALVDGRPVLWSEDWDGAWWQQDLDEYPAP